MTPCFRSGTWRAGVQALSRYKLIIRERIRQQDAADAAIRVPTRFVGSSSRANHEAVRSHQWD